MTAEGVNAARTAAKQLTLQEAEMILGVESGATWQEITKARRGQSSEPACGRLAAAGAPLPRPLRCRCCAASRAVRRTALQVNATAAVGWFQPPGCLCMFSFHDFLSTPALHCRSTIT